MASSTSVAEDEAGNLQVRGPVQGQPVEFEIDTSNIDSSAHLSFQITGPSKTELRSWPKEGARAHVVSFVPQDAGTYTLRVSYNEIEVDGSPFAVRVTADQSYKPPQGHPELCVASGNGLKECVVTEEAFVYVDTSEAGFGKLAMSMTGPSPATITSRSEGGDSTTGKFAFSYSVERPGDYTLAVRWGGVDIPGSPFTVRALAHPSNPEDDTGKVSGAQKVKVLESEGLHTGTAKRWQAFQVDTREAGSGGLSVSVQGPGKCEIQLERESKTEPFSVRYRPGRKGTYTMHVSFSEVPVPGSPFSVYVGPEEMYTTVIPKDMRL